MGERASNEITVAASPDVIMDVITDIESYPQWADGVKKVEVVDRDADGRPASAKFVVDAKVFDAHYTLAYTYGDDRVSWRLVEGDKITQLDGEYVLTPEGDETTLRYSIEVALNIPLPGFLRKRGAKQILDTGLNGVKRRAEARA